MSIQERTPIGESYDSERSWIDAERELVISELSLQKWAEEDPPAVDRGDAA